MPMTNQISRDELRSAIADKLCAHFGVTAETATDEQVFQAAAIVIREILSRLHTFDSRTAPEREVHYLSMEFLMGRSLMKDAFNLGIGDALTGALEDLGRSAADIFETEPDAGLGNGGLGRLAACYMDSLATEGIPATGYSLCYELGIFRQRIVDGRQTEVADNWRTAASSWLVPCHEDTVEVRFGGRVEPHWDAYGHYHGELRGYESVLAVPRDMLIAPYGDGRVNTLRLWEAHSPNDLDMYLFAAGSYVQSLEQRTMAEVITKVLYPADDHIEGKTLRIRQQYFFVSATAQSILRAHRARYGTVRNFAAHHVIQINDTHPTLIIPELMRLLLDEDGLGWDEAWAIVTACVNYTNHTVMSEALETWPQGLIQSQLPRVWEIICEINRRWCDDLRARFGDDARVGRNLIIADGSVHMANLCLAACRTINGVSALHGEILRRDLFRDVCALDPSRFTYVTNGIDHRRWLAQCNPGLHALVCDVLGSDRYLLHPEELSGLERAADDPAVLARLEEIKALNKQRLAAWVFRTDGFSLNSDAILDVQVKRLHEYKRQLLCAMHITQLQLMLHDDPDRPFQPRTFLFAAKAAPGYATAKRIIQLLCSLAADVNSDPVCRGRLQVYFLPNYRVSAAEMLMPAAQVSEQISTAGKEASGTGNMKLMMNGAVTIGTLDGANVEMFEQLGADNMFLFGLRADEAEALRAAGYDPQAYVRRSPWLGRVLERMSRGYADGESYADLVGGLLYGGDPYLLLADFDDYAATHERLYAAIADPAARARLSLVNIARSGIFAADRAVREYAERIWEVQV